ncbi:MAG: alpha/beta fold hydrolase [Leucobacter sp.]
MTEHTLADVNGVRIAYAEAGQGDDTVFLFHGVTANHRVWAPIQATLADRYRVIAVDQRGHGNSDKPLGEYSAEHYSQDVLGLVEQLGGSGRNVLVGHSLGARNAIVTAARFPALVSGVVAIDFTPFIEDEVFDTLEARVSGGNQRFVSVGEIQAYLQQRYVNIPIEALRRRAEYGYHLVRGSYVPLADPDAMLQTVQGLRADLSDYYRDLRVPTVVVRGAESVLVTERAFEQSRALRPDLQYSVTPRADHYVPEEEPQAVADLVTNFIEQL